GEGGVGFDRAFSVGFVGLDVEVGHRQGLPVDLFDVGGEALRLGGGGAHVLTLVEEHDVVRAGAGCAVDRQHDGGEISARIVEVRASILGFPRQIGREHVCTPVTY